MTSREAVDQSLKSYPTLRNPRDCSVPGRKRDCGRLGASRLSWDLLGLLNVIETHSGARRGEGIRRRSQGAAPHPPAPPHPALCMYLY